MQRPAMDWQRASEVAETDLPHGRIYRGVRHIMAVRKATPQLASDNGTRIVDSGNPAVFSYLRLGDDRTVTCVSNFTEHAQRVALDLPEGAIDLLTRKPAPMQGAHVLVEPYGALWLRA